MSKLNSYLGISKVNFVGDDINNVFARGHPHVGRWLVEFLICGTKIEIDERVIISESSWYL